MFSFCNGGNTDETSRNDRHRSTVFDPGSRSSPLRTGRTPAEEHAQQEDKKVQQEKPAQQEEKKAQQQEEKKPQQEKSAVQHEQQAQRASGNQGRIPDDRYKANFGREHTFRVTQGDFNNHRFQYGGYWFGFAAPWPSNWLYTQDVFVVDIGGVYYLCNPMYPGVNVELIVTL